MQELDYSYEDTWLRRESKLKMSYQEFLKSDYWYNVKLKAWKRKETYGRCLFCGSTKNIELHHITYKWIFTKDELRGIIALCREHHEEVHKYARENQISIRIASNILRSKYNPLPNKKKHLKPNK